MPEGVLCTAWHTRRCYAQEVHDDPVVWPNQQMHRHWQGNSSQGTTMCSLSLQQQQLWRNMSRGQCIKVEMGSDTTASTRELPPPTKWGWSWTGEGQYTLYWTRLLEAAHSCIGLVSCMCKKGCVRRCTCKKATQCRALCDCERDCTWRWFDNMHVLVPILNVLTLSLIHISEPTRPY